VAIVVVMFFLLLALLVILRRLTRGATAALISTVGLWPVGGCVSRTVPSVGRRHRVVVRIPIYMMDRAKTLRIAQLVSAVIFRMTLVIIAVMPDPVFNDHDAWDHVFDRRVH